MRMKHNNPGGVYQIRVKGKLNQDWETCFNGLAITFFSSSGRQPDTILSGRVTDQAALRGILCKLWDLNLTLIYVRCIGADDPKETQEEYGW